MPKWTQEKINCIKQDRFQDEAKKEQDRLEDYAKGAGKTPICKGTYDKVLCAGAEVDCMQGSA